RSAGDGARDGQPGGGTACRAGPERAVGRKPCRAGWPGRAGNAERRTLGPQPHRTERAVVLSLTRTGPRQHRKPERNAPRADTAADAPGLAARKAAARLLAAVIDAKTPLDGMTDNEGGHPL